MTASTFTLALYLLADAVVFVGAVAACLLLRLRSALDWVLATLTLVVAQVVFSLLIAGGILRRLESFTTLAISGAVASLLVVTVALTHRFPTRSAVQMARQQMVQIAADLRAEPFVAALTGVSAVVTLWLTFLGTVLPPYDYDGLWYHLTTVVTWLQQRQLSVSPVEGWSNGYPANTELIFTWQALFFGDGRFIHNAEALFAVIGALAVAGIARILEASRPQALAAASLYLLTPAVMAQEPTAYVDLAFASMFLAFFYFALRYVGRWRLSDAILAGSCAGFCLGAKSSALVFIGVSYVVILVIAAHRWRSDRVAWRVAHTSDREGPQWPRSFSATLAFALPLALLGGYWYLRNWTIYGDPLYPATIAIGGHVVFVGAGQLNWLVRNDAPSSIAGLPIWGQIARSWLHLAPTGDATDQGYFTYDQRLGAFGPLWLLGELPALIGLTIYAAIARKSILWTLIIPFTVILFLTPSPWWGRFTLHYLALGAIALPIALDHVPTAPLRSLLKFATFAVAMFAVYLTVTQGEYFSVRKLNTVVYAPMNARSVGRVWMPTYAWVDRIPEGSHIAITLYMPHNYAIYPLYGMRFKNQVYPISARNEQDFLTKLADNRANYLFTEAGTQEDAWASHDSARFHLIDTTWVNRVYLITLTG